MTNEVLPSPGDLNEYDWRKLKILAGYWSLSFNKICPFLFKRGNQRVGKCLEKSLVLTLEVAAAAGGGKKKSKPKLLTLTLMSVDC